MQPYRTFLAAAAFALTAATASAQLTWDNGEGNFLWDTTSTNWSAGSAWTPGESATFDAAGAGLITLVGTQSVYNMQFEENAQGYVFTNGMLSFTGIGIVNYSTNPGVAIASPITSTDPALFRVSGDFGSLQLSGGGSFVGNTNTANGLFQIGNGFSTRVSVYDGTYDLQDYSIYVQRGTFNVAGGVVDVHKTGTNDTFLQIWGGGTANFSGTGTLRADRLRVGFGASSTGTMTMNGNSAVYLNSWAIVGQGPNVKLTVGDWAFLGIGTDLAVSGPQPTYSGEITIKEFAVVVVTNAVRLHTNGVVKLQNGGTLVTSSLLKVNPGGGTVARVEMTLGAVLKARGNNPDWITNSFDELNIRLGTGGGVVDTAGFDVGIGCALVDLGTQVGGMTKVGAGTLRLYDTAAKSYGGSTVLSNGTLQVDCTVPNSPIIVEGGTLAGSGTVTNVTVNSGGTLSPGTNAIGTFTLNGNLVLNAGSTNTFEVDGTTPANDVIALGAGVAATYGGVLQIVPTGSFTNGQTFTLFSGAGATSASQFSSIVVNPPVSGTSFTFTNGVLTAAVAPVGPSDPAQLTNSVSGSTLILTWPAGQSWRLVGQTNNLSTGLNPATNAWFTVPGGIDGSNSITINPANPTVFYRLVYP